LKKILSYILSPIHLFVFGFLLVLFHPFQWLSLKLGGYEGHKRMVRYMNYALIQSLKILGNTCTFIKTHEIPKDVPLIIVSNHQSTYDISPIQYHLDEHHVKFVSKKELEKGVPSVSFNLRNGGSVLIDRKNPRQALPAMKKFGAYLEANNYSGVIYPEGTRSKDGTPKRFSPNGLKILVKNMPSAYIIPLTINNAWKITEHGYWPMNIGVKATWTTHKPIKVAGRDFDELFKEVEDTVKGAVQL
jgi:1-acyl-sn-glycerol-3-phosphate acyltransferase